MALEDYAPFIKKFALPAGFVAPQELRYEDLLAVPLGRQHLREDLAAVNSSWETIRRSRGGSWPEGPIEEDFDLLDLAWHEREFREATSFAYVVFDAKGNYLGCFYLYPMGVRTTLTNQAAAYDVDASWWVTTEAYSRGYYAKLYAALQTWLPDAFPFEQPYFSNHTLPTK